MSLLLSPDIKKNLKKEITEYIDNHCIFRANPAVQYSEVKPLGKLWGRGGYSDTTYVYMMRRLTHNPDMLYKCTQYLFDEILITLKEGIEYPQFQFCGLETGSIPLIAALQMHAKVLGLDINAITVRKERKSYGIHQWVEGIPDSTPIMLIDDLVNSGSSMARAADVMKHEYGLTTTKYSYTIIEWGSNPRERDITSIVDNKDFSKTYTPEKYWLPADCDISKNKRPEYR